MKWACFLLVLAMAMTPTLCCSADAAAKLLNDSKLPGGICLVVGGKDPTLALALGQDERFVVQALYPDTDQVRQTRKAMQKTGGYGRMSADRLDGSQLPHTDNLINLIFVPEATVLRESGLTLDELLRVLAPLGTVYIGRPTDSVLGASTLIEQPLDRMQAGGHAKVELVTANGHWLKITKAWPTEIDEWTHFLHGPDGNPVAQDLVVAPTKHYQWLGGPVWAQSHESDTSLRCLVTARGRLYFIINEAPTSLAGPQSPPDKWFLESRDAFNGVSLWKRPIQSWGWREWKPSWFTPRPGVIPLNLDKRVVAHGDKLYVTLGFHAPVSEIDGRTGKTIRQFKGTDRTSEILCIDNSLVLTVLQDEGAIVKRIDLASARTRWQTERSYAGTTVDYYRFTAMRGSVTPAKVDPTLDMAVDGDTVALIDGDSLVALDLDTGQQRWRTTFPLAKADANAGNIKAGKNLWNGAMIVSNGVVVHASPNQLAAISAQTGEILWQQPKKYLQHLWYEWQDVFVIEGLVWTWSAELAREKLEGGPGNSAWPVSANGYDLHTGELKRKVDLGKVFKTNHHHRCYRDKATLRYILASRRGSEFIDLKTGTHSINNWVRGACHMGMMPANGLQYAPPHPCQCYNDEKLTGFNALAAGRRVKGEERRVKNNRLEKDIAYGPLVARATTASPFTPHTSKDWPTLRSDTSRSGAVHTTLSADLQPTWQVTVGRKVGAPISVGNRVYVPLVDEHQILALDGCTGQEQWRFTAGARIDSPPTYDRGALLVGSTDGWVYRIRASDGQLVWRLRAGPEERRIGVHGQIESAWPISGSILIDQGIAYFAAGRSSQLDGGLRMLAVDALTGQIQHENILDGPHYSTDDLQQNFLLPMGVLPDILMLEKGALFMRNAKFGLDLTQQAGLPQLKAHGGLLDDAYFKRMPWSLNKSGHARVLVYDDTRAYCLRMFDSLQGLDPKVYFTPGKKGYLLYASDRSTNKQAWNRRIPIRGRALAVTNNQLCVAGAPDIVKPSDPLAAFEGRLGGILRRVHKSNGQMIAEHTLSAPPVFHGIAAANGRLFLSLEDGSVVCLAASTIDK